MVRFSLSLWLMLSISCSQPQLDSKYVDIEFKNLSIGEFLEKISKITGKKIKVDQEIKGKINFVSNEPILKSELIPLANAILESKQLTLVDRGVYYCIVKSNTAPICYLPVKEERNEPMRTVVYSLKSLDVKMVKLKIKPLLSKDAMMLSFKKNNILAVTDYTRSLIPIKMLIDKLQEIKEKE